MKKLIFLGLLFVSFISLQAQSEQMITKKRNKFYQNGELMKRGALAEVLQDNPYAREDFMRYKSTNSVSTVFNVIGYSTMLAGSVMNLSSTMQQVNNLNQGKISSSSNAGTGVMAAGLGVVLIGLIINSSARDHLDNAVNAYNEGLKMKTASSFRLELFGGYYGIGIRMRL